MQYKRINITKIALYFCCRVIRIARQIASRHRVYSLSSFLFVGYARCVFPQIRCLLGVAVRFFCLLSHKIIPLCAVLVVFL